MKHWTITDALSGARGDLAETIARQSVAPNEPPKLKKGGASSERLTGDVGLSIVYDRSDGRVEISAVISKAEANALESETAL